MDCPGVTAPGTSTGEFNGLLSPPNNVCPSRAPARAITLMPDTFGNNCGAGPAAALTDTVKEPLLSEFRPEKSRTARNNRVAPAGTTKFLKVPDAVFPRP